MTSPDPDPLLTKSFLLKPLVWLQDVWTIQSSLRLQSNQCISKVCSCGEGWGVTWEGATWCAVDSLARLHQQGSSVLADLEKGVVDAVLWPMLRWDLLAALLDRSAGTRMIRVQKY